jgi:uncharacterized repeat protein (TIGR03833 family)
MEDNQRKRYIEMPIPRRDEIKHGSKVKVIKKMDQPSGKLTEGVVHKFLTTSPTHPHGIKVQLESGEIGRVQQVMDVIA